MKALHAALLCAILPTLAGAAEADFPSIEREFRELPMSARQITGPLFWLHGDESTDRLEMYVGKVAEGGNGCFTTESRPHRDWLGPDWYRDLGICLEAAKKNHLKMWIFDEKWWPSQGVGGNVPPKYAAKQLHAAVVEVTGPSVYDADGYGGERYIAAIAGRRTEDGKIDGASLLDLKDSISGGKLHWQVPDGKWAVMKFTHVQAPGLGQGGGKQLSVDGASRDCVDWFLQTVYQPHFDHFKDDFGKTIQGFFYDEPETRGDWGTELNATLAAWGVDWKQAYVAYKFELAGEQQAAARFQYLDAFADTWGRTMYGGITEWCRKHDVRSIGHFMEHSNLYVNPKFCGGDMMRLQRYSDMGALDAVFNQFVWGKRGTRDKPCWSTPKLASSISHTAGKKDDLTMVEIFGARGQNLSYPEMKWWTDHMQVSGVNFLIPHSFNPRAPYDRDCPPYFYNGGYEPRWPLYRAFADYTSRLSVMLSGGRHVCPVAMLFNGNIRQVGKVLPPEPVSEALQDAGSDCDWVPFDIFERDAKLDGKDVRLHQERYQVLIVPGTEVIPYATLEKVKQFADQGGIVIGHGFAPAKSATLDKSSADIAKISSGIPWKFLPELPTVDDIKAAGIPSVVEFLSGDTGGWLHVLHREKAGRDVFFITNQNHVGDARTFRLRVAAAGVPECWDAMRNEIRAIAFQRNGESVELEITLQPNESALLVFLPEKRDLPMRDDAGGKVVPVIADANVPASAPQEIPAKPGPVTSSPAKGNPFHGTCELTGLPARAYLEMDAIAPEEAARVTVNGQDAGGFIGKPLRLEVGRLLKTGKNEIEITPFAPEGVRLRLR